MTTYPKWSTPNRQVLLVKLFVDSGGFCIFGHTPCRGKWERTELPLCQWGRSCPNPIGDGQPCRYKPEAGKPQLPCEVYHKVTLKWHCAYGEATCEKPFDYHYHFVANRLVRQWSSDLRSEDNAVWQAERKAFHSLGERRLPIRGRFSNIGKDIFFDKQPLFYFEGLGISGLTLQPFAKVKIASSYFHLYIDLGDSLKATSKNKRRKAIRYGKPLPLEVEARVRKLVTLAVKDYLNH